MKKAVENKAKFAKGRARLAKVAVAQPSNNKSARQIAFSKASRHLSVVKAISRAKLFSQINPNEFRIVRMPG